MSTQEATPSLDQRNSAVVWWTVFVAAAALYGATLAPSVLWQDSGEVQLRVLRGDFRDPQSLARTHILYYLLAAVLKAVPIGSVAYKANLLSAVFGAVTVANVSWLVDRAARCRLAAVAAGILLGGSHTLWQYSTMAEVMTLGTALLSTEACLLFQFAATRHPRWLIALAFVNGLGFANHNLALLSAAAYLVILSWRWSMLPRPRGRILGLSTLFWLLGASPLLVLVGQDLMNGQGVVPVAQSLLVGRYGGHVFNVSDLGPLGLRVAGYLVLNFPTPLLVLIPYGWWIARHRLSRFFWVTLSVLFAAHFAFAARYRVPDQYSFMLPAYILLGIFAGIALADAARAARTPWRRGVLVAAAGLSPAVYAIAPNVVARLPDRWVPLPTRHVPYRDPYAWFLRPWRTGYDGPARYARETLEALPRHAILWADSTLATPLLYIQHANGLRPDVTIHTPLRPNTNSLTLQAASDLARAGRLFVTSDREPYCPSWILARYVLYRHGLVFRVAFNEGALY